MIGKLTGTVEQIQRNPLLVDVGGVGYLVHVPETVASQLTPGAVCALYIHTHVREDALDLYGFAKESELVLFELLLGVSGVGPKTALGVIDRGAPAVEKAVKQSDVDFFTSIPRLGKKNAQKIIIELKNKLGDQTMMTLDGQPSAETKQLTEALLSMGFERREIREAIKSLDTSETTLEQKIRLALRILGKPL